MPNSQVPENVQTLGPRQQENQAPAVVPLPEAAGHARENVEASNNLVLEAEGCCGIAEEHSRKPVSGSSSSGLLMVSPL